MPALRTTRERHEATHSSLVANVLQEAGLDPEAGPGAALDMARSTVRRAERRTVALAEAGELPADSLALPYLNRLADLLFVMARAADGGFLPLRSRE